MLTDVVEGAAGGWRDLQEARVDEGSEGRGRLVFLHVVAGLALRRQGAKSAEEGDEHSAGRYESKRRADCRRRRMHVRWAHTGRNNE